MVAADGQTGRTEDEQKVVPGMLYMEETCLTPERWRFLFLGVGTVLRLERAVWSMVKWQRQAANEYAPPHPPFPLSRDGAPCAPAA